MIALPQLAPGQKAPPDIKKITQAAQQFEALLLNTLLRPLEDSFSALPGTRQDPGADSFSSLATESLSGALAAHGGLGIAKIIVHKLMQHKGLSHIPPGAGQAKVPTPLGR
jgi:Rod binding domain-containing protein